MALIHEKIPAIIGEVKAVGKDHTNTAQNYKFRAIDDVYNALNGVLAKHKVSIIPKYTIIHNEVTTEIKKNEWNGKVTEKTQNTRSVLLQGNYKITAEDGSFEEVVTFGEAIDFGDKAFNKAMSQALKYCLFQVFCIPTEEEKDTEHQSPTIPEKTNVKPMESEKTNIGNTKNVESKVNQDQIKRLMTIAGNNGWTSAEVKDHYCTTFNIKSGLEMNKKQYDDTVEYFTNNKKESDKNGNN